ncbi:peptidoglycan DD-metalloendopeptidase family protein [Streptomyces sp. NPDC004647]|uniref:M23 family metallopeptidase n=1 Tax=Streptomyces sp. NPDC004647 TaxID=3154671 RepID=UPI0033BCFD05
MNDRHPSGGTIPTVNAPDASHAHYTAYDQQGALNGHAGYDGYATGTFDNLATAYGDAAYGDGDPLFGSLPGSYDTGQYDTTQYGSPQYGATQYATGNWDTGHWDTSGAQPAAGYDAYGAGYDAYGAHPTTYETGSYDTSGMWAATGYEPTPGIPAQAGPVAAESLDTTGQLDATGWNTGAWDTAGQYGTGQYDASFDPNGIPHPTDTDQGLNPEEPWDNGPAQNQSWDGSAYAAVEDSPAEEPYDQTPYGPASYDQESYDQESYDQAPYSDAAEAEPERTAAFEALSENDGTDAGYYEDPAGLDPEAAILPAPRRADNRPVGRSRRRTPARRSALLTVAVPSVAVMGVAGIAAASVSGLDADKGESKTTQAAADVSAVKPAAANSKLDSQLATLTADADDFADRASRTQERIDLKQRQLDEKKRKEAEAARKEALRPKFAIPVEQHGLSATYGQAGVNWMSVHSGIDFPVSYGTPVMAATDGTVRTQYNLSYGNMAIVTAPDGTETWYCHLSSTKIRSGSVKAGDVIAYSGNSGNSTGPHLHFEVHPGGDSAIDPLPWLRSKGLDPT